MEVLFSIVLPIFALIGVGWLARRFGWMGPEGAFELNRFVVYLGMPALLFQIMARASFRDLAQPGFIAAFGIGSVAIYGATVLVRCWRGVALADASLEGLNAGYANTGFIGFPLCLAAFGPASMTPVTITVILTVCVLFGMAVAVVEFGVQQGGSPLAIAGKVLVSLGLFIADTRARPQLPALSAQVALKLVGQPLLTWVLARWVFGLPPLQVAVAVVIAALPTGTGPFMLANMYRREAGNIAGSILVSTVVSVVTISVLITLLRGA